VSRLLESKEMMAEHQTQCLCLFGPSGCQGTLENGLNAPIRYTEM